jgi:hypothetical protein
MRRKLSIKMVEAREEVLDLISFQQKSNTLRTHSNLWSRVYSICPSFVGKPCHWAYNPLTQELFIREGTSKTWWFNFTL